MANSLNEDLARDTVVVLRSEIYNLADRRFRVKSGFGLSKVTVGSAVFGEWVEDGQEDRVDGYDIDPAETRAYWGGGRMTAKFYLSEENLGPEGTKELTEKIIEVLVEEYDFWVEYGSSINNQASDEEKESFDETFYAVLDEFVCGERE